MSSDFDIQYIAGLARINIDADQAAELEGSIEKVLGFVDQVRQADVPDVDPADFFRLTKNRLRPDTDPIKPGTYTDEILRVAPKTRDNYVQVAQVISKEQ